MHISGGKPAKIRTCQSAQDSSVDHAQRTRMHTNEEKASQIKAQQSAKNSSQSPTENTHAQYQRTVPEDSTRVPICKGQQLIMNREYTCSLTEEGLLESSPANLQRTAANHEQETQIQTSRRRPTGIKARQSAKDSSAKHGHPSRDYAGAQDLRCMPHHQTPLVKNLESKG